jgi:hypothetical protein
VTLAAKTVAASQEHDKRPSQPLPTASPHNCSPDCRFVSCSRDSPNGLTVSLRRDRNVVVLWRSALRLHLRHWVSASHRSDGGDSRIDPRSALRARSLLARFGSAASQSPQYTTCRIIVCLAVSRLPVWVAIRDGRRLSRIAEIGGWAVWAFRGSRFERFGANGSLVQMQSAIR